MKNAEPVVGIASDLRRTISELFEVSRPDRIVLTPGILVALRLLFSHLRIRRILLTGEEYYGESHFPGEIVRVASCEAIPELLEQHDFQAVVASPASWQGVRQPVAELFGEIRKRFGSRAPLLVADCAHAGSIGFPSIESLGADVVCGDLEKWILPPEWNSRVAFLWFRTHRRFASAAEAFRPFFLATESSTLSMEARWVSPADVLVVSNWLSALGLTRERLLDRHLADMKLARRLASNLHPPAVPETSILWLEEDQMAGAAIEDLEKRGLVWRPPGGGARVLCRSDVLAGETHETAGRQGGQDEHALEAPS